MHLTLLLSAVLFFAVVSSAYPASPDTKKSDNDLKNSDNEPKASVTIINQSPYKINVVCYMTSAEFGSEELRFTFPESSRDITYSEKFSTYSDNPGSYCSINTVKSQNYIVALAGRAHVTITLQEDGIYKDAKIAALYKLKDSQRKMEFESWLLNYSDRSKLSARLLNWLPEEPKEDLEVPSDYRSMLKELKATSFALSVGKSSLGLFVFSLLVASSIL